MFMSLDDVFDDSNEVGKFRRKSRDNHYRPIKDDGPDLENCYVDIFIDSSGVYFRKHFEDSHVRYYGPEIYDGSKTYDDPFMDRTLDEVSTFLGYERDDVIIIPDGNLHHLYHKKIYVNSLQLVEEPR